MTECVCDYTDEEIEIFVDRYKQGLAANVSIGRSASGVIFLTIHKGGECICMYELLNGKWVLIPSIKDNF
ncbi:hypothetical protein JK207_16205 [Gluconobacter cerinus]|uniref:hypothetical protein n=1 Tax=Gluconobacter cerinus TaxID=38307 RepID=UPI001B8B8DA5|nr:hypothetical protein [Gluconobacter cerinus]MBS1023528.1 hypothetical protein [Gluconobacter cerinus]